MGQRKNTPSAYLTEALSASGLRMTHQRQKIFDVLMEKRDHPTADEVFSRVKNEAPHISLATVYNSLETLVGCGVVKQVNHEREPTRYCANLHDHAHFYCTSCGSVHDIDLNEDYLERLPIDLPADFTIEHCEVTLQGICPNCQKGV